MKLILCFLFAFWLTIPAVAAGAQPRVGGTEVVKALDGIATNLTIHGVRSSDGTSGADAVTGGVTFKDGFYTGGAIFGTNWVTNAISGVLSNGVFRGTNINSLDFRRGPDVIFQVDSGAVQNVSVTGLVINTTGSGGLVRSNAPNLFAPTLDGTNFTVQIDAQIDAKTGPILQSATNYANSVTNASIVRQTQATTMSNVLVALAYSLGTDATNFTLNASNAVRLVAGLAATNHAAAILQAATNYANATTNSSIVRQTQLTAMSNDLVALAYTIGANGTNYTLTASNNVRLVAGLAATNHAAAILQSATNYADAVGTIVSNGVVAYSQPLDADLTAIAALGDPGADRILFWDDSAGAFTYLTIGANLTITSTTIDAGGGGIATNANQFGASTTLTIKSGAQLTNTLFWGQTNAGNADFSNGGTNYSATAPWHTVAGLTTGSGTEYSEIGYLDPANGTLLVETWTNVTQNVTNIYNSPWPTGLGWCYQVASSNAVGAGFVVHYTNGPCGAPATAQLWGTNAVDGSITNVNGGGVVIGLDSSPSGTMTASEAGAIAHGTLDDDDAIIQATDSGAFAGGYVGAAGVIEATGVGAMTHGSTADGTISSQGQGSSAIGMSDSGVNTISAVADGGLAGGHVTDDDSAITSDGVGALAFGSAFAGGIVLADGDGSLAVGRAGTLATIDAGDDGAFATGYATTDGTIDADADGAFARGFSDGSFGSPSLIIAGEEGAFASGYAFRGGTIDASDDGAFAWGYASSNSTVRANGDGSFAGGRAFSTGLIQANANAAFAFGFAEGTNLIATGNGALAIGVAPLTATGAGAAAFGNNAEATNDYAWVVNLDPAVSVGSITGNTFTVNAPNGARFQGGGVNVTNIPGSGAFIAIDSFGNLFRTNNPASTNAESINNYYNTNIFNNWTIFQSNVVFNNRVTFNSTVTFATNTFFSQIIATNAAFTVNTNLGAGGALTNFTVNLDGDNNLFIDGGTTNVNLRAMNWAAGLAKTVNLVITNRTATVRTISFDGITNNWLGMGTITGPIQLTNGLYLSIKSMGGSNMWYGAQYTGLPTQ